MNSISGNFNQPMVPRHHSDMTGIGLESRRCAYLFFSDDILCKELREHKFPVDFEGIYIELNFRKTNWLILWTYRPPNQSIDYFFKNAGNALDIYSKKYDKFYLCGDFISEPSLSELLLKCDSKNVVMEKTCFKNK